ncbi:MAG TPA: TetR/AcrR family transcriptional regulator [Candidatus Dormibacteraeota bacterium]|jgi:AcrR family transcriptional regulator|nr:TetR/AcrR family transcriptional regulator [Candidatus Dormibacteraeota bacterium]
MTGASAPRRGRPARLSREQIVDAAERVVTTEGVEALTMRRVAALLKSSPMAIYRHVRDRDELLLCLLDRTAARLPHPDLPADPRQRLLVLWRIIHDGLAASPWVIDVLVKGDLAGSSILWAIEEILAAFVETGLSPEQAAAAYRVTWQYTVGVLTIRIGVGEGEPEDRHFQADMIAAADPARTPIISALASAWPHQWDNYEYGLSAVLQGLLPPP